METNNDLQNLLFLNKETNNTKIELLPYSEVKKIWKLLPNTNIYKQFLKFLTFKIDNNIKLGFELKKKK